MSEVKFSNFRDEDGSRGPDLLGITTFTSPHYFVPPSGTTAQRPSGDGLVPGMLRFNTDIGRLEVWRGDHWAMILGESPNLNGGSRGLFGGGYTPSYTNVIQYITISTLGNAIDFGDLSSLVVGKSACASSTRGIFSGGIINNGNFINSIEYVTISSTGDVLDFGDLNSQNFNNASCSNSTRGIIGGGFLFPSVIINNIDYITMSSTGDAKDFGDLLGNNSWLGSFSSSTRGIFGGGYTPTATNVIQFITISTIGNAIDFGDLTSTNYALAGCSNSTRGVFSGGRYPGDTPTAANIIDYITIASTGNAQDFGDLTVNKSQLGACSSPTRGVFAGGQPNTNIIDYVTILTTGNALDFGDLISAVQRPYGCSNAHGGL